MTNCAAHLNPVNSGGHYRPHCNTKWQLADLSSVPPDQKQPLSWKKTPSKIKLPVNKLSELMLILVNDQCGLFGMTGRLLCCDTPKPACSLYSCQTGGCFSRNWELLSEPQLVMFTIFIPVEGKVKYDCAVFKLWVWVYTGWHQQSAITFKDAIDVLFTASWLVVGVEDKTEGKKQVDCGWRHYTLWKV